MSSRSHPRPPTGVIGGAVAAGSVLVAGAVFAGAMTTGVARRMVGPGRRRTAVTAVLGVDPAAGRIRFAPTDDAALPGVYSFWFDEGRGHARVGRILDRTADGGRRGSCSASTPATSPPRPRAASTAGST